MCDRNIFDSASDNARLIKAINEIISEAKRQHEELTDADLDRAIRILTFDRLDRVAVALEKIAEK